MKLLPWLLPLTAEGRYNASGTSTVSGETHPQLRAILKAVANAPQLSVWRASENSTGFPPSVASLSPLPAATDMLEICQRHNHTKIVVTKRPSWL
eukprot:gene7044-biopygen4320